MWIGNAMAKNFMSNWGNIPLAKGQKAKHLPDRVAFCPLEIDVWHFSGDVVYVNQDCGDCVGDGRADRTEDLVSARTDARDPQRSFEFRRIDRVNFQKEQLFVGSEIMRHPRERISRVVLLDGTSGWAVGDNANNLVPVLG